MLDTDVVIDYLRGQPQAVAWMHTLTDEAVISVVTVSELYAGVREGPEKELLADFLDTFRKVSIDEDTARCAGLYKRDFGKSHNTGIADAMIAASAQAAGATLLTFNLKHFPMLEHVRAPYAKS